MHKKVFWLVVASSQNGLKPMRVGFNKQQAYIWSSLTVKERSGDPDQKKSGLFNEKNLSGLNRLELISWRV